MALQYISDISGKHTAVIIPIKDRNSLKSKFDGLDQIEKTAKEMNTPKPSGFKGAISKDTARKMNAYVDESRPLTNQLARQWHGVRGVLLARGCGACLCQDSP